MTGADDRSEQLARPRGAGPGADTGAGADADAGAPANPAAAEAALSDAPRLLSQRADPAALPEPLHDAEVVASLHRKWAQLSSAGQGATPPGGGDGGDAGGGGVRAKVRARVVAAARADSAGDRALIGDLIRAVDAAATRLDDLSARVGNLELLVQEVLDRLSEDLVRVQAALGRLDRPPNESP